MKAGVSLFLCLFIFTSDVSAGTVDINLMDRVTLDEKTITLSDVSTVTGDNIELVNKINDIAIGRTPWPNNTRRISIDFVKMRLKSSHISLSDLTFNNTRSVAVSVESTKITGIEIVQEAKEYLLSVLPVTDRETTIELVRMPADQWIPRKRDDINLGISIVDAGKDRGNIGVIVSAYSNGVRSFKMPVYFKVRVFEYVAVAKRKIGRHKHLAKENVFMARRETTKIRGLAFSDTDELIGKMTTVSVLPYTIITEDMVEVPPTIKKGSVVKLVLESSGFSIVTKGLAQQTGYTGDIIRVRNLDSKKILYGKVVSPEKIQIVF